MWNKSGTNWGGIGYNGQTNENYFGPCDSNGVWTNTDTDCWTFRNRIKIVGAASNNMAYNTGNPRLIFAENANTQQVGIVYTDYDSYRSAKGLRIMDVNNEDTDNVWLEVQGNVYAPTFVGNLNGNAASATYTTQLLGVQNNDSNTPYSAVEGNLIRAVWNVKGDNRWYLKAGTYNCRVNYSDDADTIDGYHASQLWRSDGAVWNPGANIKLGAAANGQEWSFDITRNGYTGCYWHVWDSTLSTLLKVAQCLKLILMMEKYLLHMVLLEHLKELRGI